MKINNILTKTKKMLHDNKKEETIGIILLAHVLDIKTHELYKILDEELPSDKEEVFLNLLQIHIKGNIPVQYIINECDFYNLKFYVDENVLIPRNETEELVLETILEYDRLFDGKKVKVCDIGTGSGCIAVSLSVSEPNMEVFASDISDIALNVARKNAELNKCNVEFLQGDMLNPYIEKNLKFDIVVSNPPYIPKNEDVMPLVKDNEPHLALFGGEDGLLFYRRILKDVHKIINNKALICFEHAYDKKNELHKIIKEYINDPVIVTKKDLNNLDRMTFIYINLK